MRGSKKGNQEDTGLNRTKRVLDVLGGGAVERSGRLMRVRYETESQRGLVVVITERVLELRLPTVDWSRGPHRPVTTSRRWRRHSWEGLDEERLRCVIKEAQDARQRQFARCKYCSRMVPPERRISADVCHGCASTHLNVVF